MGDAERGPPVPSDAAADADAAGDASGPAEGESGDGTDDRPDSGAVADGTDADPAAGTGAGRAVGPRADPAADDAGGPGGRGADPDPFEYPGGTVPPGETVDLRYPVSETYLGDPVRVPVTVVNGPRAGPTAFLCAAVHGDELNGVELVREVAQAWDHDRLAGTLVCLPVMNVPGFLARSRCLPAVDRDLNRSFPGNPASTSARRIADALYDGFLSRCDFGLDFHTSSRGRTNALHVRAGMDDPAVARLARAFGANVVLDRPGPEGSLRRTATADGVPTVTVEMGQAHRFQRELIDRALVGVDSVLAEYGMRPDATVAWPGWRAVVGGDGAETAWVRADAGGLVETHCDRGDLVRTGQPLCTVADPFGSDPEVVRAPFTGLVLGIVENPVVSPGNPLCHLADLDGETVRAVESARGEAGRDEGESDRAPTGGARGVEPAP